jgi:xylulokinase
MAHYLGLELATEHIRGSVVDEGLDVIFTAAVEFDTDLPEFQTRGGLFTAPGDVYTTSVEMWLKALGESLYIPGDSADALQTCCFRSSRSE